MIVSMLTEKARLLVVRIVTKKPELAITVPLKATMIMMRKVVLLNPAEVLPVRFPGAGRSLMAQV